MTPERRGITPKRLRQAQNQLAIIRRYNTTIQRLQRLTTIHANPGREEYEYRLIAQAEAEAAQAHIEDFDAFCRRHQIDPYPIYEDAGTLPVLTPWSLAAYEWKTAMELIVTMKQRLEDELQGEAS